MQAKLFSKYSLSDCLLEHPLMISACVFFYFLFHFGIVRIPSEKPVSCTNTNPFLKTGLFLYPWKNVHGLLMFSQGAKRDQWHEMS